jgi:AraC family transcriptional regulator of adaptative response / DNA-3-methyladenine glycosylase II
VDAGREREEVRPVTVALEHRLPYAWDGMVAFLAGRAVQGVEEVVDGEYRRAFVVAGEPGTVAVRAGEPGRLVATFRVRRAEAVPGAVARLRRLLDLDADPVAIDAHLGRDPALRSLVRAHPGVRVPGAWEPFEIAVRGILGQQISVAAARTIAGRIAAAVGEPVGEGGLRVAFPDPARLARASLEGFGLTRTRAAALVALARAVEEHPGLLAPAATPEETIEQLVELPGIGEWTAQYIAMRGLGDPDAFPAADLGLLRAARGLGRVRPGPAALRARAERWRPYRAYAAIHLWGMSAEGRARTTGASPRAPSGRAPRRPRRRRPSSRRRRGRRRASSRRLGSARPPSRGR